MKYATESSDSRFHKELKPMDRKDKPVKQSPLTNEQYHYEVDDRQEDAFWSNKA